MISYDLDYEANGGRWKSQPEKQTDVCWTNEITIASSSVIERTGYTYQGWNMCSNGTGKAITPELKCYGGQEFEIDAGSVDADGHTNIVLYAQWSVNQYPLHLIIEKGIASIHCEYKYKGQTVSTNVTETTVVQADYESEWKAYAEPKTGWTYTKTSKGSTEKGTIVIPDGEEKDNKFSPSDDAKANTISVSFNGNGATTSETMGQQQFTYDTPNYLSANKFVRGYTVSFDSNGGSSVSDAVAKYAFTNWNDKADGSGVYTYFNNQSVTNPCGSTGEAVMLYAQWDTNNLTCVRLSAPTKDGHTFTGWYSDYALTKYVGRGGDPYTPIQDTKLYAKWGTNTYTVTFYNDNPSSGGTVISEQVVEYGKSAVEPEQPTKAYYKFSKWSTDEWQDVRRADIQVWPEWKAKSYRVLYCSNYANGQIEKDDRPGDVCGEEADLKKVTLDDAETYGMEKDGYSFTGWETNKIAKVKKWAAGATLHYTRLDELSGGQENVRFYAIWSPKSYSVSYDDNGATGGTAMESSTFTYDKAENLPSNTYECAYVVTFNPYFGAVTNAVGETNYYPCATSVYAFASWNDKKDGSGAYTYGNGAMASNICGMAGADATLYAQWITNDASVVVLPLPVREGYTFNVWTDQVSHCAYEAGTSFVPTNDTTLVAEWKANIYPLELRLGVGISNIWYSINNAVGTNTTVDKTVWVECGASWRACVYNEDIYPGYQWNTSCTNNGAMTTAGAIFAPTGTPNTISVRYNGNGEKVSGGMSPQDFLYNVPGNLSSNGYSLAFAVSFKIDAAAIVPFATSNSVQAFDGWSTNSGVAQVIYANGALVTNICGSTGTTKENPISLYAQWTTNASSVVILPPAPEKEGYSFNGWYLIGGSSTNKVGNIGEEYVPVADTTLVGGWDLNSYDLTIAVTNGIDEITYATGRKTGVGQNPPWDWKTTSESCTIEDVPFGTEWHAYVSKVKDGYVYTGEYASEKNCYTGYVSSVESENVFAPVATKKTPGALTLTIGKGIEKIRYAIGEEPLVWEETTTSATVAVSCDVVWQTYALAKSGYTTNSTCAKSGTMAETGDTFTPSADANRFCVSYDRNGATGGAMEDSSFTYDQDGQLPANGYTRAYAVTFDADGGTVTNASGEVMDPAVANSVYAFAGWATSSVDAVSHRVTYADGAKVKNLSTGDPVTLYAVWTTNESSVVTMPGAQRDEDLLLGWQDAAGLRVYGVDAAFIPTNDTALVAQWQIVLNDLSRAVGLTNAVLRAVADGEVRWEARTREYMDPAAPGAWDADHTNYVRLVNNAQTNVSESSSLKLYLRLEGSGQFVYQYHKKPGGANSPSLRVLDIYTDGNGKIATNQWLKVDNVANWTFATNRIEKGSHEIYWIVTGDLAKFSAKSPGVCLDNMSWTPDEEPEPEPTPVVPGGEMPTYGTEEEAKVAAQSAVVVEPNTEVSNVCLEAGVNYGDMFVTRAVETAPGSGEWTLQIQLKESVSNEVQTVLNEAETNLCSVITNNPISVTFVMKPGLYYGLAGADVLADLPTAVVPDDKWVLGTGDEKGQSVTAARPSETNAFYQLRMAITRPK